MTSQQAMNTARTATGTAIKAFRATSGSVPGRPAAVGLVRPATREAGTGANQYRGAARSRRESRTTVIMPARPRTSSRPAEALLLRAGRE